MGEQKIEKKERKKNAGKKEKKENTDRNLENGGQHNMVA